MGPVEFFFLILLIGALALLIVPRFMKRGPRPGAQAAEGTLLITGVSPRPLDAVGEQFVTISGVINGPTVSEHVVYQRMAVDVDSWPSMGGLIPVIYSPRNPDQWTFAPPDAPPTEKPLI